MSLHAQLTPEAEEKLRRQRRNSSVLSMLVGVLSVVLLALTFGLILFEPLVDKVLPRVTWVEQAKPDPPDIPRPQPTTRQTPSAPANRPARVIITNIPAPLALPRIDQVPRLPSNDFGQDGDFGRGGNDIGNGPPGDPFTYLPPKLRKRCSQADRLLRLQENGGTEQCEEAVVRGLDWLRKTQAVNGSWGEGHKSAMTGLALLAYLGHCETPLSEKYGDSVLRGLTFLIDLGLRNNGKLIPPGGEQNKHWPYEHAIATYALAEAATFCRQLHISVPKLPEVTQQAGQYIIDNQHQSGGWDYAYDESGNRGGDLSVTAWHIQALKACHHTGFEFRNLRSAAAKATGYVTARQASDGGFCYTGSSSKRPYKTMTGGGMLCLQMWDKGSHSGVRSGAKYVRNNSRFDYNTEFCDLYGHYYESQAMMNRGGEQWKWYNKLFRDQVLVNQAPDGSWKNPGGGRSPRAVGASFIGGSPEARHYRTCLCILMLEVYYRYLPGTAAVNR